MEPKPLVVAQVPLAERPQAPKSGVPRLPVLFGEANCAWLKRLKNSARKFRPMFSQGSLNCLITEKSVLTKSGPVTGSRLALPSSPDAGWVKHAVLNHSVSVRGPALGLQPATMLGRIRLSSLPFKKPAPPTPLVLLLSMIKTGKPEVIFSMTVTCQPPKRVFIGPLQDEPKRFPVPNGRS